MFITAVSYTHLLHASLVPVTSVLKGITYPPSMAEAVEIVDGSRTLVDVYKRQGLCGIKT